MKRIIALFLSILVLLAGCAPKQASPQPQTELPEEQEKALVGLWITYSELSAFSKDESGFEAAFTRAVENAKTLGVTDLFVHVRAFCDAVYPSNIFPFAQYINPANYDMLEKMISVAKSRDMRFHAWINPYRVSTSTVNVTDLPSDSPVLSLLQETGQNICVTDSGIYLNPASVKAKRLILDGVRELLNYDIDGIHMDDYFYPTDTPEFDKASYEEYQGSAVLPLSLAEWRRSHVNALVSSIYRLVKSEKPQVLFGISPAADLDRCYNQLFADIEGWIGGGYLDYIMPQLYFGFEYPVENFQFENLLVKWRDISRGIPVYAGLAAYKTGTDSPPDSAEWNEKTDILARQIKALSAAGFGGYVYFSYSSLFSDEEKNTAQRENILKYLQ